MVFGQTGEVVFTQAATLQHVHVADNIQGFSDHNLQFSSLSNKVSHTLHAEVGIRHGHPHSVHSNVLYSTPLFIPLKTAILSWLKNDGTIGGSLKTSLKENNFR